MILYTARASALELHDLVRVKLEPMSTSLSTYQQKRWLTFNQFILHEQRYLDAMHKLQYEIYNTLLEGDTIAKPYLSYAIFGTHQKLCQLHQFTQRLLEVCVKEWPDQYAAGWMIWAMLEQPALVPLYKTFITSYTRTVALYAEECANNHIFSWFLTLKLREFGEQRNFTDYFVMPVQRIPQLVLEVKTMMACTDSTDPDWALLDGCVKRATSVGEQLNEAAAKQELVRTILNAIELWDGARSAAYQHGRYQCELLHSGTVTEVFSYGTSFRLVVLLSDRLVCLKPKEQKNRAASSKHSSLQQELGLIGSLKWVLPLQDIEMDGEECGVAKETSGLAGVTSCDSIAHIRDFETLFHVRDLLSTVHRSNDQLRADVCTQELNKIWSTVLPQEDALAGATLLRVKENRGKPHILKLDSADAKKEWYNAIRLGQLALRVDNCPAWWNGTLYAPYEPLFVKTLHAGEQNATVSTDLVAINDRSKKKKYNILHQVTAGCCYVPNTNSTAYSNELFCAWSKRQQVLWISSIDRQQSSKVSLYTHDRTRNTIKERASFTLQDVRIQFIAHVPVGTVGDTPTDTVWIATRTRLLIYSATFPMIQNRLKTIVVYGSPNRILYHEKRLFVSTIDKQLLIFSMDENEVWNLKKPQKWKLGSVEAMTVAGTYVCMAIDANIHMYDSDTGTFIMQIASPSTSLEDTRSIMLLQYSVHGLWVGRERSGTVSLYHARCYKHLLDVDVGRCIERFQLDNADDCLLSQVFVTSLLVLDGRLWIGTNVGILLTMQLPSRANVPFMTDQLLVAYHGHMEVNIIIPLPSLRVREETEARIEFSPDMIEKLFRNTRKASRDLRAIGVHEANLSFIDLEAMLSETLADVHEVNVSPEYADDALSWNEDAEKAKHEERTDNHKPWAPDSLLVVTGGYGRVKLAYKPPANTSLNSSNRSLSASNLAQSTGNWRTGTIYENGNLMLWETRMT
uniref:DH domain-containing protein n=1 Tax=Anopheles culicifacies TaxID=139723 RepID=A0A182LWZ6_9DIPT